MAEKVRPTGAQRGQFKKQIEAWSLKYKKLYAKAVKELKPRCHTVGSGR